MSDATLIRWCAPTLARLKTGNLFNGDFASREDMVREITELNRSLRRKGVIAIPLRYASGKGLIYLYRPQLLRRDLSDPRAKALLRECGYTSLNPGTCLAELVRRMRDREEFPHEIGLFLGYPPADVDGFMHHREDYKVSGLWKVYEDEETALRTFERYRRCTREYMRRYGEGFGLDRLCVAAW